MDDATTVLEYAVTGGFVALAAAATVQWRRYRGHMAAFLAAALFLLAVVAVLGRVNELLGDESRVLDDIVLVAFLASGYCLLMFCHSFVSLSRWLRIGALLACVAVAAAHVLVPLPRGPNPNYTPRELLLIWSTVTLWAFCASVPAVRLWRAARGRPHVQHVRLRALAVAYGGLVVVVLFGGFGTAGDHPVADFVVQAVVLLLIPVIYVSFAPPSWMRRAWRRREEDQIHVAQELAEYASDLQTVAQRGLDAGMRLVGASDGFVVGAGDELLAVRGLDAETALSTARLQAPDQGLTQELPDRRGRYAIMCPITSDRVPGMRLCVVADSLTPMFGSDEAARLLDYAALFGVAADRVRLVERLEQEIARNQSMLQAISDLGEGFVISDGGRLLYANDAYLRMTGYTYEELLALPSLLELSHPAERDKIRRRMIARISGGAVEDHYDARMIRKDGRVVDCEVAVKLLMGEEGPLLISVVRDITDRKRSEAFRRDFIANAAHELRTPVTAIVGFAKLLASERVLSRDQEVEVVSGLDRQSTRLSRLVSDLLDLTRLQQGQIELHPESLRLGPVVRDVVAACPSPQDKSVDLDIGDDLLAVADPRRLDDVLTNLLTNAYRYGGDKIRISAVRDRSRVIVTVSDNGTGVPIQLAPRLFEPFVRGRDSAASGGSGLGLAIVRTLARAMEGDVWHENGTSGGTRFCLSLPASL